MAISGQGKVFGCQFLQSAWKALGFDGGGNCWGTHSAESSAWDCWVTIFCLRAESPTFVCILSLLLHLCCAVSYCVLSCLLQNSVGLGKAAVPNPASSPQLCPGKPPALTMRHRSAFLPIQPSASLVRRLRWMLTVIMVLTFAHQELEWDHNFMSYRSPVTIKR